MRSQHGSEETQIQQSRHEEPKNLQTSTMTFYSKDRQGPLPTLARLSKAPRGLGLRAGRGLLFIGPRHLNEELPQLGDVVGEGLQGRGRALLALLDEVPQTDAVHELSGREKVY